MKETALLALVVTVFVFVFYGLIVIACNFTDWLSERSDSDVPYKIFYAVGAVAITFIFTFLVLWIAPEMGSG